MYVYIFNILVQGMAMTGFFETYLEKMKKDFPKKRKKQKPVY